MLVPGDVTVVIAAKDEEATIVDVVSACHPYAADILVVVHCRCQDETAVRARAAGARVIEDHGLGKGDALRCAIDEIKTGITVFIDADGSHDPADIPRL